MEDREVQDSTKGGTFLKPFPMTPVQVSMLAMMTTLASSGITAEIKTPAVLNSRLEIRLIASEPEMVTPVGIAADKRGQLLVVESHTHFPKNDYSGPKSDRVKLFRDTNGDGTPDSATIFAEGFRHAMNIAIAPDNHIYLVHRNGVLRLDDTSGDGVCDSRAQIVEMITPGNYPHNGLGGIAFSPDGHLYIGQGENFGEPFTLKGSDGSTLSGKGDGGNIFRCRLDGSKLEKVATGFWNPFGLAFFGKEFLLAVDNDPDSSPPNRLLDVVQGGDYGFKFRFGRNGLHAFQSWNGELPGTLPMIAGVGEASCAVMPCDQTHLPASYRDAVLVTAAWDHRIEVYRPKPFGASLRADREVLVQGDDSFRPVALTTTPDGSVYFTDWVDASYNVHGKGRVWKLSAKTESRSRSPKPYVLKPNSSRKRMNDLLHTDSPKQTKHLFAALSDNDPFTRSAAVASLSLPQFREAVKSATGNNTPAIRLGALLALRRANPPDAPAVVSRFLADPDVQVRLMAVVWAGEQRMTNVAERLSLALNSGQSSTALLRAHAATALILSKATDSPTTNTTSTVRYFTPNEKPDARSFVDQLKQAAVRSPRQTQLDAIRHLAQPTDEESVSLLKQIASDRRRDADVRAEAILALNTACDAATFLQFLDDTMSEVRVEAARALRHFPTNPETHIAVGKKLAQIGNKDETLAEQLRFLLARSEQKPPAMRTESEWKTILGIHGDEAAGRRLFFNPTLGCANCHRVEGHGGHVGPDLSVITRGAGREKLMISILHPSRDIAPQFVTHTVTTTDGESYSGLLIGESVTEGITLFGVDGRAVIIPPALIASRKQSDVSLMPEGLEQALTPQDFRDLIAFLMTRK